MSVIMHIWITLINLNLYFVAVSICRIMVLSQKVDDVLNAYTTLN